MKMNQSLFRDDIACVQHHQVKMADRKCWCELPIPIIRGSERSTPKNPMPTMRTVRTDTD